MSRSSVIVLFCAAAFALSVLLAARKLRVSEKHTLAWLFISAAIASLAIWRDAIDGIALAMGIHYAPSALFFVVCGGLLLFVYRLSLELALLRSQVRTLGQEVALLSERQEAAAQATGAPGQADAGSTEPPARVDVAS